MRAEFCVALGLCALTVVGNCDAQATNQPADPRSQSDVLLEVAPLQGGYVRGSIQVDQTLEINGRVVEHDQAGRFFVGLDRDAGSTLTITESGVHAHREMNIAIPRRDYQTGIVITGLSKSLSENLSGRDVSPTGHHDLFPSEKDIADEAMAALGPTRTVQEVTSFADRLRNESVAKAEALSEVTQSTGFTQSWRYPIATDFRVSSPWGAERTYAGKTSFHGGLDMAAPSGTSILAPADGVVTLADDDFYYEGGVVFVDHGQGLTSMYLHMSQVDVVAGEEVAKGQKLGAVGATGRATGPHLCWRLYWNGRFAIIDPQLLISD